jgi:tRNA A-37 threonylcarbamoyl transferase component Bud32
MQTVAQALAGMHAKTVVLFNLSAGNIFLREKNNVLFGDWSMARETRMG